MNKKEIIQYILFSGVVGERLKSVNSLNLRLFFVLRRAREGHGFGQTRHLEH